jgi:hypothetical protein
MTTKGKWWWSHFDRIPSALFGNEVRTRCTIAIFASPLTQVLRQDFTTSLMRWVTEQRDYLFSSLTYSRIQADLSIGIPKVASQIQADTLSKLFDVLKTLAADLTQSIAFSTLVSAAPQFPQPCVYVGGTAYNWFPAWRDIPNTTDMSGKPSLPARTAGYRFPNEETADIVFALFCSSLGYWWWAVASDGFNLKKWLLDRFPLALSNLSDNGKNEIAKLGASLRRMLRKHYVYKDNRGRIGNFYLPACVEEIRAIDDALAKHIPNLSKSFFDDIRAFNENFSRSEAESADDE